MNAEPVIEVSGLTKTFGDFTAVDRLDLRVDRGSICAFLGANGSGKSTTIRMLIGLLRPTAGQVTIDGIDVMRFPRRVRDHVGYMSQRVSLYATLSLRENLEFYAGLYGLAGDELATRWDVLSRRFDLREAESEIAQELPAGIRQRAGLAFSMLHEPGVLFLDEPTAGVDLQNRLLFWDIIQEEAANGVTIFVTTHFLEEVEYCDWACFIDGGTLIANGTPEDIRARYSDGYRVRVTAPPDAKSYVTTSLAAATTSASETEDGVELLVPKLTPDLVGTLRSVCAPHGPGRLHIEQPNMTDVFRRLMVGDANPQAPTSVPTATTPRPPITAPVATSTRRSGAFQRSWRRLRTLMLREIRATMRERPHVAMLLTFPVCALLVFGSILSTEVEDLPLAYHDASRTQQSRRLLAEIGATGTFRLREHSTRSDLARALTSGTASVALIIPPDFARALESRGGLGPPPEIQILYDGAETVLAGNAEAALQGMVTATGARLRISDGRHPAPGLRDASPAGATRVVIRALFNPTFDGVPFMVAGTFGFVLGFLTTLITAVSVVNERITGTFEQLQITPATSAEIVLGKILPLGAIFVLDVMLMVILGGVVLDAWPRGNPAFFVAVSTYFVLISLALGLIISATSATAAAAVQKSVLLSVPLIFLAGFIFPIRNMPLAVQWLTEAFPATHYIRISRAIYLRGQGPGTLLAEEATLVAIGIVLMLVAFRSVESRA